MTRKDEVGGKDWAELRARLESARGPRYWRSLEEVAETDAGLARKPENAQNRGSNFGWSPGTSP